MTRKPDFFIVGAPKCGTTALYSYLQQHPDIYMPRRKEPHFFCPDLPSPGHVTKEADYAALFAPAAAHQRAGEASVYYLYSRQAAARIKAAVPDARIIIMLRDPVAMMYSLHSQRLFEGHEDLADFADAIAAEPDRRAGRRIPKFGTPEGILQYRDVARFAPQVERYFAAFGRDRVLVILHEELAADAAGVYARACAHLGLAPHPLADFAQVNPNKAVRSGAVRDAVRSNALRRIARALLPRERRVQLARWIKRLNTQYVPREAIDPALAARLRAELAPDVEALARVLDRDLGAWIAPRADAA
jgi:hypothetical protein